MKCTIILYNKIQTHKALLPTPNKCHYMYNLRDVSKVFFGINKAAAKNFQIDEDLIKIWINEC